MYSRESVGVGFGRGAANGFELLEASIGLPNQVVLAESGSHPFFANTPTAISTTKTSAPVHTRSFLRFSAFGKLLRGMGTLLLSDYLKMPERELPPKPYVWGEGLFRVKR
jgi:hypothetical protein